MGRVDPSRADRVSRPSASVGFTYGYPRCPASRDSCHAGVAHQLLQDGPRKSSETRTPTFMSRPNQLSQSAA